MTTDQDNKWPILVRHRIIIGAIVLILGLLLTIAVLLWLASYGDHRAFDWHQLMLEWPYWFPVLLFFIPGLHFTYYGIQLLQNRAVKTAIYFEFLLMLGIMLITGFSLLNWTFP